jgi:methionyl-tRNA formyltransferase
MKALFFGTPELAAPFLSDLADAHDVVGVVSQPDKPVGRGLKLEPTPVKAEALKLGLRVFQPNKPSEIAGELRSLGADLAVTCAYGRILRPDVLTCTRLGCVNVHFSLLPKYRGAAPMAWTLLNGETRSGITIFWMDEGMDTGPMLLQRELQVGPDEDHGSLAGRLVSLGRQTLAEALKLIEAGSPPRIPQSGQPSLAPKITKELGAVDWTMPAPQIHNRARALRDWPKASVGTAGKRLQLLRTRVERPDGAGEPGRINKIEPNDGFLVECASGAVWVDEVQPEGRSPMSGASYLNGVRLKVGAKI